MPVTACEFESHFGHKTNYAKIAQLVEHNLAKVGVAGSSPVFRSKADFGLLFLYMERSFSLGLLWNCLVGDREVFAEKSF